MNIKSKSFSEWSCHKMRATDDGNSLTTESDFLALWSSHCQVKNRPHGADSADPDYQYLLFSVARGMGCSGCACGIHSVVSSGVATRLASCRLYVAKRLLVNRVATPAILSEYTRHEAERGLVPGFSPL